jgi:hypothetical protein
MLVVVALIPRCFPLAARGGVDMTNVLLRRALPSTRVIDFYTGILREDVRPDGIHLFATGQAKLTMAASMTLSSLGIAEASSSNVVTSGENDDRLATTAGYPRDQRQCRPLDTR